MKTDQVSVETFQRAMSEIEKRQVILDFNRELFAGVIAEVQERNLTTPEQIFVVFEEAERRWLTFCYRVPAAKSDGFRNMIKIRFPNIHSEWSLHKARQICSGRRRN